MKVGIITMHHVDNLGSVLQSYALQHKIELMGYDAMIIDYRQPPKNNKEGVLHKCVLTLLNAALGFPKQKFQGRLNLFKSVYYKCTVDYFTRNTIRTGCPLFDIYCTGSDQVWNPRYIGDDTSYMLDFAPVNKPRISYAASFATDTIPNDLIKPYSDALSKYQHITVREEVGVELVKKLTGKESKVVCDPTLLLTAEEWGKVAELSSIEIKDNYILVYLLGYMFDPRPYFYNIVKKIQKELGYKVYFVNGWLYDMKQPNSKVLFGVGPSEFIHLFQNASFVITDSFHGTAFATIFNRPMLGVVKSAKSGDGRLTTLLRIVGNENAIVQYDKEIYFDGSNLAMYQADDNLLVAFRNKSIKELSDILGKNEIINNYSSL